MFDRILGVAFVLAMSSACSGDDAARLEMLSRGSETNAFVTSSVEAIFAEYQSDPVIEFRHHAFRDGGSLGEFCKYLLLSDEPPMEGRVFLTFRMFTLLGQSEERISNPPCASESLEKAYFLMQPEHRRLWIYYAVANDDLSAIVWSGAESELGRILQSEEELAIYIGWVPACTVASAVLSEISNPVQKDFIRSGCA